MDDRAEVLLQVPRVNVDEISQPANAPPSVGTRRRVAQGVELLVMSITFTPDELADARGQLGLGTDQTTGIDAGKPVVVALAGEYRVPIVPSLAARRSGALHYVFYVPSLPIGVSFPPETSPELLEAFEFIVKSYGSLVEGGIPTPDGGGMPQAAQFAPPYEQRRALASDDSAAQPPTAGVYQPPNPYGYQQQPPVPLGGAGAPPPPQQYGGQSLEEQQAAAAAAAKQATEYVVPRAYPGSQTTILQTHANLPPVRDATRLAHGVTGLTTYVANLLTDGADVARRGIDSGADHVVASTAPCENPVHVPDAARNRLRQGRMVSRTAVGVSSGFATSVVGASAVISNVASGTLRSRFSNPNDGRAPPEPTRLDDAKQVGLATVGGAVAVVDAATEAARTLLTASLGGVQKVVTHKLGSEAGEAAGDGFGVVTDGVAAANNMRQAGVKSLVKATVKDTAKKTFSG